MHSYQVIKNACIAAIDEEDLQTFGSVVDPKTALEMVNALETAVTQEDMDALTGLIQGMVDYLGGLPGKDKDRDELINRGRMLLGLFQ